MSVIFRETMLQAVRFIIQGGGGKIDAALRKSYVSLLIGMLGHDEVIYLNNPQYLI